MKIINKKDLNAFLNVDAIYPVNEKLKKSKKVEYLFHIYVSNNGETYMLKTYDNEEERDFAINSILEHLERGGSLYIFK